MKHYGLILFCILAASCSSSNEAPFSNDDGTSTGAGASPVSSTGNGASTSPVSGADDGADFDEGVSIAEDADNGADASPVEGAANDEGASTVDDADNDEVTSTTGDPGTDEGASPVVSADMDEGTSPVDGAGMDEGTSTAEDTNSGTDSSDSEGIDTADQTGAGNVTITFDITVPEYLSNHLRVTVYSDEQSVQASYVSGQSWTATMSVPSSGSYADVIFFDRKGDLSLAALRPRWISPSSLADQEVVIEERNFTLLDYDNDGTDNITELQQGTDPLISDGGSMPSEISWRSNDVLKRLRALSAVYEINISSERPWSLRVVEEPGDREDADASRSIAADIDSSGNGEFQVMTSDGNRSSDVRYNGLATRRVLDDAVVWAGEYSRVTFPEENTKATFKSETRRYSEFDYGQAGNFASTNTNFCCLPGETAVEYSVIGSSPDADGFCNVSYGSITATRSGNTGELFQGSPTIIQYSRANALRSSKWRVTTMRNGVVFSDYVFNNYDDVKAQFYCEFGDL